MTRSDPPTAESERIRRVYGAYEADARCRAIWSDSAASRFMKARKWEGIAALLRGFPPIRPGIWVLDLGAGVGTDSVRIAEAAPGVGGIVAIDILKERVAEARGEGTLLRARIPLRS